MSKLKQKESCPLKTDLTFKITIILDQNLIIRNLSQI
jgi:hypothetical protein